MSKAPIKTRKTKDNTDPPQDPPMTAQQEWADFIRTAAIAIFIALLIRTFLFEPFNIPSSSMKPTLLIGDYLFVSKYAYGYSRHSFPFSLAPIEGRVWAEMPERGDVIVFKLPSNTRIDYIKRVIGLPGDVVQVREGRLYINNIKLDREPLGYRMEDEGMDSIVMNAYLETLPGDILHEIYEESDTQPLDDTLPYLVPEGHVFVMGDNRDNSQDSRVQSLVGFVPLENIVGRAEFLFFSTNGTAAIFEFWKWPWAIRYSRILQGLEPVGPQES